MFRRHRGDRPAGAAPAAPDSLREADGAAAVTTEEPEQSGRAPMKVTAWLAGDTTPALLGELLGEVIDPELGINIVDLGLIYDLRLLSGTAQVRMTMTTPGCPLTAYFDDALHDTLWGVPGVDEVDLQIVWDPPWSPEMMSDRAKSDLGWAV